MNVINIYDIRKLPANRRLQSPPPGVDDGTLYVYTAPTLLLYGQQTNQKRDPYTIKLWEPHNNGDDNGNQGRIHHEN